MRRKVVVAIVLLLVGAWAWIASRPTPEERLAELIAELRARGEPVTVAEMEPPMPPDADNGVRDLEEALGWFEERYGDDDWDTRIVGPWNSEIDYPLEEHATPEQLEELRDFLEALAPFFERVDRGVDRAEVAWPSPAFDEAETFLAKNPMIRTVQPVHRFLAARAEWAREEPERRRAVLSVLRLGARLRARTGIEHLVGTTTFAGGCLLVRDGLEKGLVDPHVARRDLAAILRTRWGPRFPDVVRAERAMWLEMLPRWLDGSVQAELEMTHGAPPSGLERFWKGVRRLARGRIDFESSRSPVEMIDMCRDLELFLDPALTAEQAIRLRGSKDLGPLAFVQPRLRKKLVDADAFAAMARTALAAHEHRLVHGDWPSTSDDLVALLPEGGVPRDPFTDEPFVMERDGDDLVLRASPWEGVLDPGDDPAEFGYVWRLAPR